MGRLEVAVMYPGKTARIIFALLVAGLLPVIAISIVGYVPAELSDVYYLVVGCAEVFILGGILLAAVK